MIRYAVEHDFEHLKRYEKHISESELKSCISQNRIIVLYEGNAFIGWLRYNFFWDNTPFMNLLFLSEQNRKKGYGTQLVTYWEQEMRKKGYKLVLTSTLSNEQAQFFYRKNGYTDCGALLLPEEPLEIVLLKRLE